jgi:isoleucyl-tRNA synthetase
VRRSRRRFWTGDPAALATLHECLYVVTLLLAPITPFITERVWQDLFTSTSDELPDSVHLASVAAGRRLARRRHAGRADGARAPARRARARRARVVERAHGASRSVARWSAHPAGTRCRTSCAPRSPRSSTSVVSFEELAGELVDVSAKGNFRSLGKRFGKGHPEGGRRHRSGRRRAARGASLREHGQATVTSAARRGPSSSPTTIVVVTETPVRGLGRRHLGGETVALDLTMTPSCGAPAWPAKSFALCRRPARPAGLEVTDRIALWWAADDDDLAAALREHGATLADEVLATALAEGEPDEAEVVTAFGDGDFGARFWLRRA